MVKLVLRNIERTVDYISKTADYLTSLGGYASVTSTRFLRFATSSSFTLTIDMLLLAIFVEIFGIYYLSAAGLSFIISTSINYFINRNWGFKGTVTRVFKGYALFLLFSIFGIALTVFLMWIFVEKLFFYYIIARIIVAMIEGSLTFIANSVFTFKMPKELEIKKDYFEETKKYPITKQSWRVLIGKK
jgi:putative flippase GtrA